MLIFSIAILLYHPIFSICRFCVFAGGVCYFFPLNSLQVEIHTGIRTLCTLQFQKIATKSETNVMYSACVCVFAKTRHCHESELIAVIQQFPF